MIEILIIAACIALNGLLSGTETAFIALSRSYLRELVKRGEKNAKRLLQLRENPEKTLSIIQIGITFVGVFASAVGGAGAEEFLTPWIQRIFNAREAFSKSISILLVVISITFVSVVIGELVPKILGLRRPMFFALKAAPWLHLMSRLMYPVVIVLEKTTKGIISLFPKRHVLEEVPMEESGIKLEALSAPNQRYVLNIVKLERTLAREIVLEWSEVDFVDVSQTVDEVENVFITSGHTRLPVLENGKPVGILNSKEFIAFRKMGQTDWKTIIRPIEIISENMPILAALRSMQEKHMHMAVVVKDNVKLGIITMDAILEEIVGDMYDEDDDGAIERILSRRL